MTLRRTTLFLVALALLGAEPGPPQPGTDPIGRRLYPPELIMGHQQELGVTDEQRAAILKEIEKAQPAMLQAQWQLQAATEGLAKLLEPARVDEAKALAQADKVMALEREMKRAHLGLLVRIKNLLSEAQQSKLAELRGKP